MKVESIFGTERFITNSNGDIESVMISLSEYNKISEIIEDRILSKLMKEAESEDILSKKEALKY